MTFCDYVELLYKAYLEVREIIKRLRDKMKDASYLQDLETILVSKIGKISTQER